MHDAPAPVKDNSRAPAEKPGPCCICCEPLSIVQKVERDLVFAVH